MKLAVALQLRTTITEAILRQPAPVLAHRAGMAVTSRSSVPGVQPIGQPKPLTDVKNFRIGPLEGLETQLKALPPAKGILEFDVETQQMYRQLEALDAAIQTANHTVKHALPGNVSMEPGDRKGEKKTLAAFLLRRKTLKERAQRLEQYLVAVPQKEQIQRTKRDEQVDDVTIVYPLVNHDEVRRTHNQTMMSLRAIDNLIQQANWGTEVDVQAWVRQGFLSDDIDPPISSGASTKGGEEIKSVEPPPSVSPVAPMLSVSPPALKAATPVVPALAPAAATPTEGTALFIPPNLDVSPDDEPDEAGWTS